MHASSVSTMPDTAEGLFSSGRAVEGSEELVFYLLCWFPPPVNHLVLCIEKTIVMSQLNDAVTAEAFGGSLRNITIEEVGVKNPSGWREGLCKHFHKRSIVKSKGGKSSRGRWSGHCITAQRHPPRSREEEAARQLCICLLPLSHSANTAAMLERLLPGCIYTKSQGRRQRGENKREGSFMQGQRETLNQKGRSTFSICPKQAETNSGCTCMVPVSQHQLEVCATSISAAGAYRWP